MGKKKGITHARLNVMLKDLINMRDEMLGKQFVGPDGDLQSAGLTEQELKNMDAFSKLKARLNVKLRDLKERVTEYKDKQSQLGDARNPRIIALQNDNAKEINNCTKLLGDAAGALAKDAKKGKLAQDEINRRQQQLQIFEKEIRRLKEDNSHRAAADLMKNDPMAKAIEKNREAREARRKRREQRREKTGGGAGGGAGDDGVDDGPVEMTAQEQAFYEEKAEVDQQIDMKLDQIMAGLKTINAIAVDIGANLDEQEAMLEEVDTKIDEVGANMVNANKRLKNLVQETTGGTETWCPILILFIILLGIAGYIFGAI